MKALTLWRPWNAGIMYCGKPVENRGWRPPHSLVGHDIALHNGKTIDDVTVDELIERYGLTSEQCPGPLGIVGVARLVGYVDDGTESGRRVRYGVDEARANEVVACRWWCGPVGWVLDNVRPLATPVPCRGAQGLWTLPADVEAAVLAQEGGAK